MLDDSRWATTSALIDESYRLTDDDQLAREGPLDDVRVIFVGVYCRGQRREDQERDYLGTTTPTTNASRDFGFCPTAAWCTSGTC